MKVEDIIKKEIERLKRYENAANEIEYLNVLFKNKFGSELYEYQKQFVLNINTTPKGCVVKKCRRAGISTTYGAHLAHLVKKNRESMGEILICSSTLEIAQKTLSKAKQFCDLDEVRILSKKVSCCSERNIATKTCSHRYDELFIDEAAFFSESLHEILNAIFTIADKIIVVSTPNECKNENSETFEYVFNTAEKYHAQWLTQVINWYEVPYFNRHLTWKKIMVEPTIDKEGNVEYNKEVWERRIKEGWIPTSPKFEDLKEILGPKADNELLED